MNTNSKKKISATVNHLLIKKMENISKKNNSFSINLIKEIRSFYLLLLKNRFNITYHYKSYWLFAKITYNIAAKFKERIHQEISSIQSTGTSYYYLVLTTLTKWQKHIHINALNEVISYCHLIPKRFPVEIKTYITAFICSSSIICNIS